MSTDTLVICCEHHLTSLGRCNPYSNLPLEIVDEILAQLAAFGSQYAYTEALVHPRYSQTLKPRLESGLITFARAETGQQLQRITKSMFLGDRTFCTLRLGPKLTGLTKKQMLKTTYKNFFEEIHTLNLQLGYVFPGQFQYRAKEVHLLSRFANHNLLERTLGVQILCLFGFGWYSLLNAFIFTELDKVRDIYFFKIGLEPWENICCTEYKRIILLRYEGFSKEDMGKIDFSHWALQKFDVWILEKIYMIEMIVSPTVLYCAIELKKNRQEWLSKVAYYTFYCKEDWR